MNVNGLTILLSLGAALVSKIWEGFVLTKLWIWFIVPFFEASEMPLPTAMGVCLIFEYVAKADVSELLKKELFATETSITDVIVGILYSPGLALLLGWIVSFFMKD
jgi:hypothetical protein